MKRMCDRIVGSFTRDGESLTEPLLCRALCHVLRFGERESRCCVVPHGFGEHGSRCRHACPLALACVQCVCVWGGAVLSSSLQEHDAGEEFQARQGPCPTQPKLRARLSLLHKICRLSLSLNIYIIRS